MLSSEVLSNLIGTFCIVKKKPSTGLQGYRKNLIGTFCIVKTVTRGAKGLLLFNLIGTFCIVKRGTQILNNRETRI